MEKNYLITDSTIGSSLGYIYQFEKSLLTLVGLQKNKGFVSVESVDDISAPPMKHELR